jgi:hypothetical protein
LTALLQKRQDQVARISRAKDQANHKGYVKMQTIYDLFVAVGEKLAGRKIALRFQAPSRKNAAAQMTKMDNGQALIDVCPDYDDEKQLFLFLHECAHARLHWLKMGTLTPGLALSRPAYSQDVMPIKNRPDYQQEEEEANAQAKGWMKIARRHAEEFTGPELESRLWALWKYYNE